MAFIRSEPVLSKANSTSPSPENRLRIADSQNAQRHRGYHIGDIKSEIPITSGISTQGHPRIQGVQLAEIRIQQKMTKMCGSSECRRGCRMGYDQKTSPAEKVYLPWSFPIYLIECARATGAGRQYISTKREVDNNKNIANNECYLSGADLSFPRQIPQVIHRRD